MSTQDNIDRLNTNHPPFLTTLGGATEAIDVEEKTTVMSFAIPLDLCHSGNVIQGGFVAAMLDAAMSHAVLAHIEGITNVLTLDLKISYLRASLAGSFTARGKIIKAGRSIAFLEGELFNGQGELTATASSTAKIL